MCDFGFTTNTHISLFLYSEFLSDSIMSILSNSPYIAKFTIIEKEIVSKTEYRI